MTLTCAIVILLTSLLALPFSYVLNVVAQGKDQMKIFMAGAVVLLIIGLLPQYIIRTRAKQPKGPQPKVNSFIHVLSLLTFNSVMSLTIALENDGLIAEFLGSFLREGEPYLKSAHGTMMCYWDGIYHNAMYLTMMAAISWNQSFYDIGLYWAGSFSQRLVILFLAVMLGKDSLRWAFLLYVPFMAICIWSLKKFLREKSEGVKSNRSELSKDSGTDSQTFSSIWKRPFDLIFVAFYVTATVIAIFRFTTAMGPNKGLTKNYVDKIEPYLQDTLPFAKAEIMIQMFYFVPYYAMSIYALLYPGQAWVPQWSIIYAGAAGHSQFSFMGSSFHYRTPYIYRVPQTYVARGLFWFINGMLFLVPQLMAYKFNCSPDFFLSDSDNTTKTLENGNAISNSKDSPASTENSNVKKTD